METHSEIAAKYQQYIRHRNAALASGHADQVQYFQGRIDELERVKNFGYGRPDSAPIPADGADYLGQGDSDPEADKQAALQRRRGTSDEVIATNALGEIVPTGTHGGGSPLSPKDVLANLMNAPKVKAMSDDEYERQRKRIADQHEEHMRRRGR